jgi:hypothetical protein
MPHLLPTFERPGLGSSRSCHRIMIAPTRHSPPIHQEEVDDVPPQAPKTPGRALQDPARAMDGGYPGSMRPTLRALEHLKEFIASAPTVIAGDFNHCVAMDKRKGPGRRFSEVLSVLKSYGLESAWHSFQEEHGAETTAKLYWRWNAEHRFHIDFVFHSERLKVESVSMGAYEKYVPTRISDHVTVTVDFAL